MKPLLGDELEAVFGGDGSELEPSTETNFGETVVDPGVDTSGFVGGDDGTDLSTTTPGDVPFDDSSGQQTGTDFPSGPLQSELGNDPPAATSVLPGTRPDGSRTEYFDDGSSRTTLADGTSVANPWSDGPMRWPLAQRFAGADGDQYAINPVFPRGHGMVTTPDVIDRFDRLGNLTGTMTFNELRAQNPELHTQMSRYMFRNTPDALRVLGVPLLPDR